jgi:hypothetical protein
MEQAKVMISCLINQGADGVSLISMKFGKNSIQVEMEETAICSVPGGIGLRVQQLYGTETGSRRQ